MEFNGAMLQYFHWYTPNDGSHWNTLASESAQLVRAGFTSLWLPPAYKGFHGSNDVGYAVYDLYDLGEFDQKGSIRTKYGTKEEYVNAIQTAKKAGLRIYADMVFNHKLGADESERFNATPYHPDNRLKAIGPQREIHGWTKFTFPGRANTYSDFKWNWRHFNALDYNIEDERHEAVYLIEDKKFHEGVDLEKGNFDYLMGCNLDMYNPEVKEELFKWGEWYLKTTDVDGFRFDAVKHVKSTFFLEWMDKMQTLSDKPLFAVGEYWSADKMAKHAFIERTQGRMMLFDVRLHYNFAAAGRAKSGYDLRSIFDGSLVKDRPYLAVTLVANHDTQPLQSLESVVEQWFKPLAYALILLRRDGYPCVFAADYYGATYTDKGRDGNRYTIELGSHKLMIDAFLKARREFAYGLQKEYFDHPNCIGWSRMGTQEKPGGLAVLLSNAEAGEKWMQTSSPNQEYMDITGNIKTTITSNADGQAMFTCKATSVSVWVPKR